MMHGAPARVLAQHLGRNLRFKGSPVRDRPRSSILRHQLRSRQAASEHPRPVLGHRITVYSRTGVIPPAGMQSAADMLLAFDDELKGAKIDLTKTFDGRFVAKAAAQVQGR